MLTTENRFDDLNVSSEHRPSSERFEAGVVLADRYRMVMRIGLGGMAEVWQADDLLLRTPVALKLIHSTSAEARRQLVDEVKVARQITHPAVCRVFDVGEAGDTVFYSMELVRQDLQTLLQRVGRLSSAKVIDIARQLCGGLAAAHAKGVLHRDLKPAHVLIDDEGRVRIADFGIASTGAPLSPKTDLYALGIVMYTLATGQHPFTQAEGSSRLVKPSALVPDLDPELERVILQALAPREADRPQSAAAFAASLPEVSRRSSPIPPLAGVMVSRLKSQPWFDKRSWSRVSMLVIAQVMPWVGAGEPAEASFAPKIAGEVGV